MNDKAVVSNTNDETAVQALVADTIRGNARLGTVSGFLLVVLGILAVFAPFISGIATSGLVAAIMVAAGMTLLFFCFKAESFGRGLGQFLLGAMSIFCGTFMLMEPIVSLFTLTGILLVYFLVDGLVTLYQGIKHRPQQGWGWVVFSGISSIALGALLAYQWPDAGFYAIGILVGARLLISGWSVAMLGMAGDNLGEGIAAITEEERNALREHADALVAELDEQEARGPQGSAAPQPA